MRSEADIKEQIRVETAACVEDSKRAAPFGGFFTPRKKLEPGCELKIRSKYAGELAAAQAENFEVEQRTNDALFMQLSGGGDLKQFYMIGFVVIAMIIIAIIIA